MTTSDLPRDPWEELDLTLAKAVGLGGNLWGRVLRFLLRWEHYDQAAAYAESLLAGGREQVSVYDALAEAHLGLGQAERALEIMRRRHAIQRSLPSTRLEVQALLKTGQADAALALARRLAEERPDAVVAWTTLGEALLAYGALDEALAACASLGALRPNGRSYLLLRMEVHLALGDHVVAGAYAARVESSADDDEALPAYILRRLESYYITSQQPTRAQDVRRNLLELYRADLDALREALAAGAARPAEPQARTPRTGAPARDEIVSWPEHLPARPVPVSDAERHRLEEAANRLFGFASLRSGQAETMAAALRGEDVLTVLPTGGGKSLCYQLPALLDGGTTLVLSPLIALMKDQVDSLPEPVQAQATVLNYTLPAGEIQRRLGSVARGAYRLVYAAPERLRQETFLDGLRRGQVSRLVIDEAHCISMWGHDFRPDYLYIHRARQALGNPPVLAMTATAPPIVRQDIVARLSRSGDGADMHIVSGPVTRPNLFFEVVQTRNQDEKLSRLLEICLAEEGSGIVYVDRRDRAERLAALLQDQRVSAGFYHAGIGDGQQRSAAQERFMSGEVRIMVATVAFGMGIDKSDIRFIVHFCPPPSIESYYQEAGRAGRDGLPARCILLYSPSDRATLTRRSRRDAMNIEFLRHCYAALRARLGGRRLGQVAIDDLRRDCQAEETAVRVAIGLLEEARMLRRYGDLPRVVSLRLAAEVDLLGGVEDMADLAALARATELTPYGFSDVDLAQATAKAGLDLRAIEGKLLRWSALGLLSYRGAQRDVLLELLPPGDDAAQRVENLLEQYALIQARRIDEISRYATTQRCRHGHLSGYLSGEGVEGCTTCDNCVPQAAGRSGGAAHLPDEPEQLATILRCLDASQWGWGRISLARILRADQRMQFRGAHSPQWGALRYRSEAALTAMVERLIEAEYITVETLDSGGEVLRVTRRGSKAAARPERLRKLVPPPDKEERRDRGRRTAVEPDETLPPCDEELFQTLRAWRSAEAASAGLPPYYIAHYSLLRRLASLKPRTMEALLAVKGMGPARMERYGEQILRMIHEHLE